MKNNPELNIREQVDRLGRPGIRLLDQEIERIERNEALRQAGASLLLSLLTVSAIIILVTNLWVGVMVVDGSSMNPQLHDGEIVLTVEYKNPHRLDIIAFNQNNKFYIKRVIATEGDSVSINNDGVVSVNDELLNEPYVARLSPGYSDIEFPYIVPAESVFVLGDNRAVSSDSRNSRIGPVNIDQIVGEVIFIVWPIPNIGSI